MVIELNKEIALQFYRAFDDRNIEQAFSLLSDNFIAYMAGIAEPLDKEGFKQFGGEFYTAFHNGKHTFDEIIVEGERIVTCGKFTAIHLGIFQGLPPTKKQIEISPYAYRSNRKWQDCRALGARRCPRIDETVGNCFFTQPQTNFEYV